jgi:hypothetical protein
LPLPLFFGAWVESSKDCCWDEPAAAFAYVTLRPLLLGLEDFEVVEGLLLLLLLLLRFSEGRADLEFDLERERDLEFERFLLRLLLLEAATGLYPAGLKRS